MTSLDFRVYRVDDPVKFFAGLRDPHVLGSEEPVVPQERTLLERMARWKAARRDDVLRFLRGQFSHDYRRARRESVANGPDHAPAPARVPPVRAGAAAQRERLVASWREMLPMVRDTEARNIPLELPGEGVYVVEAVNGPVQGVHHRHRVGPRPRHQGRRPARW